MVEALQNPFITVGYHSEKYFCDRAEETKKLKEMGCRRYRRSIRTARKNYMTLLFDPSGVAGYHHMDFYKPSNPFGI